MIQAGQSYTLQVLEHVDYGVFLDDLNGGEVLLPSRYVPEDCSIGAAIEVFIYLDSEDRLIATTETPFVKINEFALLEVVATERMGAFLDWGLAKDLFLPFAEQTRDIRVGQKIIVYAYLDKSGRISASMRLERNKKGPAAAYAEGEAVELMIAGKTDLGYKAIINGAHWGVLFENEVFKALQYGQIVPGFIRKLRDDGKIDLTLQKAGHQAAVDDIAPKILALLDEGGGFLEINDKTPAEKIYELFGVSKKKYKIALGGLYKKRVITVTSEGIRLCSRD